MFTLCPAFVCETCVSNTISFEIFSLVAYPPWVNASRSVSKWKRPKPNWILNSLACFVITKGQSIVRCMPIWRAFELSFHLCCTLLRCWKAKLIILSSILVRDYDTKLGKIQCRICGEKFQTVINGRSLEYIEIVFAGKRKSVLYSYIIALLCLNDRFIRECWCLCGVGRCMWSCELKIFLCTAC